MGKVNLQLTYQNNYMRVPYSDACKEKVEV